MIAWLLFILIISALFIGAIVYKQEKAKEHRIELIKMYLQILKEDKKITSKDKRMWKQALSFLMIQWFPDECKTIQHTVEDIETRT
jgi:hypothetical protein